MNLPDTRHNRLEFGREENKLKANMNNRINKGTLSSQKNIKKKAQGLCNVTEPRGEK